MKRIFIWILNVITSSWLFLPIQIECVNIFQLLNEDKIGAMNTQNVILVFENIRQE